MLSAAYTCIQADFRLDFFLEINNMKPDQTAPLLDGVTSFDAWKRYKYM